MPVLPCPVERNSLVPWRSAWLGASVAAIMILVGAPLFVRMPPWCDLTLYELAADAVMRGGVHYRDVFDTNLPGFVWALIAVRRLLGSSVEVLRVVDLLIVAASVTLLLRFARRGGATTAGIAWTVAAAAAFYLYTSEFCHAQRDVWMLLPAVVAVSLRQRQRERRTGATTRTVFLQSALEGAIWGLAVWIKPHVLLVAAAMWLVTCRRKTNLPRWTRVDLPGQITGGGLVGILGFLWLLLTGTLPHFIDILTTWNTKYLAILVRELPDVADDFFRVFPGWSLLHGLAIPVTLIVLIDEIGDFPRLRRRLPRTTAWYRTSIAPLPTDDRQRQHRVLLAALYLAWTLQAFTVQRNFEYVHVPEILLSLALLASLRWAGAFLAFVFLAFTSAIAMIGDVSPAAKATIENVETRWPAYGDFVPRHPITVWTRTREWPCCWQMNLPAAEYRRRADAVAINWGGFPTIEMTGIGEVADYLRAQGVRDGEVLCWSDSPHAVYRELGIEPRFRFMHVSTPMLMGNESYQRMLSEMRATALPSTKYVVSDLKRLLFRTNAPRSSRILEPGPDLLPPILTAQCRAVFPYDQPAVFRSGGGTGRYLVHKLTKPVGLTEFEVEVWNPK